MAHDYLASHVHRDDEPCELCASLSALEDAVRSFLQTFGCTCDEPTLTVALSTHTVEIIETHDPSCVRAFDTSRN